MKWHEVLWLLSQRDCQGYSCAALLPCGSGFVNKNRKIFVFSAVVLLFSAVVWLTFVNTDFRPVLQLFVWQDVLVNILLGLAFFVSFGVIMWVGFRLHYNLRIQWIDLLTLPLMMHLFTYLLPIKGGMLFQVFYSKSKYQLDLSKGFSLGIAVFLISVLLTVIMGLGISLSMQPVPEVFTSALIMLGLGFISLMVVPRFIPAEQKNTQGFVGGIVDFLVTVRYQLAAQIKNISLLFGLITSTIFSIFMQSLWYWQSAHMIGVITPLASVVLMVLFLRIFLLVRLLPGNLGFQELVIGLVFSAAGLGLDQGLMVALLVRVVSIFLAATIGLFGLYSNLNYLNVDSISGLIRNVAGGKG